jgi:hypothetical protein
MVKQKEGRSMLTYKNYIIAAIVSVLIILLVHVAYDIAVAMNTSSNIEFYVAFLGGCLTLLIYNSICNRKKTS